MGPWTNFHSFIQEAWGSHDSGQIQELLQCCQKPYRQIPLVITIQKKYSLIDLRCTVSKLLKKRSKVKFFDYTGVKQVKCSNFADNGLRNVHQVINFKILLFAICEKLRYYGYAPGYAAKTVCQWRLTFSLHNHVNETCYIW